MDPWHVVELLTCAISALTSGLVAWALRTLHTLTVDVARQQGADQVTHADQERRIATLEERLHALRARG